MTSSGMTPPTTPRVFMFLAVSLLLLLPTDSYSSNTSSIVPSKAYSCPRGCECNESTVTCTSVVGLRGIDKSLPIKRLVLSGLELTKIPAQLENIRNITELDLSNNRLAEVNHLGKRIRKLNLSQNKITSGKLARVPSYVESLNLTHNEITYLPLHLMKLKKLRYIELADNPINCTCETLHIRNWLTTRHVWSDQHIKCSAPQEFKGRPWLQVKQADVCHGTVGRMGGYNWDDYEDENDLMLGDQADLDAGEDGDVDGDDEDGDEFDKEYFPVAKPVKSRDPPMEIQNDEELADDGGSGDSGSPTEIGEEEKEEAEKVVDVAASEGSGEEKNVTAPVVRVAQVQNAVEGAEEDDDGSGSGGGVLIGVAETARGIGSDDGFDEGEDDKDGSEEKPISSPGGLGIFGKGLDDDTTASSATESIAAAFVPMLGSIEKDKGVTDGTDSTSPDEEQRLAEEPTRADTDSKGTYILLAILGIVLLSLILLVMCKQKPDARNRRDKSDVETGNARELQDMDKNLLGKPIEKNGHNPAEKVPLMNDKSDHEKVFSDKPNNYAPAKPERTSLEKPTMESFKPIPADRNKSKESLYENMPQNNNNYDHNTVPMQNGNGPVSNGDPAGVHQPNHHNNVPSEHDEVFLPPNGKYLHPEPPSNAIDSPKSKRYSPIYVPTSPKSDRYSPVYSPETGRVKIKLTETPKPKTPILVTRSRSRAGDYITTPDQKF